MPRNARNEIFGRQQHPIYNTNAQISKCEMSFLTHSDELLQSCNIKVTNSSQTWIQLHSTNNWIFSMPAVSTFNIVCGRNTITRTLKKTGIIQLQPGCNIKEESMTIRAQRLIKSTPNTSMIIDRSEYKNISQQLNDTSNFSLLNVTKHNNTRTLNQLLDEIETLKKHSHLSDESTPHDLHQYILISILVISVIGEIIFKVVQKVNKQRKNINITKPTPAKRSHRESPTFILQDSSAGKA